MREATKAHTYRHMISKTPLPSDWMFRLTSLVETRKNDDSCIQQLLELLVQMTQVGNISIAMPESTGRFRSRYSSRNVENGMYSHSVQQGLSRAQECGSVLIMREGSTRPDLYSRDMLAPSDFSGRDHCLLVPLKLRHTTLAVMVLDLRETLAGSLPLKELWLVCSQIAHMLATQIVPNFQTLYSRPYRKVDEGDLDEICSTITKCGGNKTMAARLLGLTPRQLRYRLSKLSGGESSQG